MESLRRPSVLAAIAGALLVVNIVVLAGGGGTAGVTVDDPLATTDGTGSDDEADAAQGATGDDVAADGEAAGDTEGGDADGSDAGASTGDGSDEASTGDADGEDAGGVADGTGEDGTAPGGDGAAGLTAPTAGTYEYASSGNWSFANTGAETEEYQLPATATGVVSRDGSDWRLRLVAGDRYADEFGFLLGADGGLDWVDWVLERVSPSLADATSYTCSGDSAHYRPDEQGRVATHVCETSGITSTGSIEHTGTVDVTLGDGSVVAADQLLYTYSVQGDGVSGGGQLDIWLDPTTGLRLKEVRSITTTGTTYEYREDVEFTLQSLNPT